MASMTLAERIMNRLFRHRIVAPDCPEGKTGAPLLPGTFSFIPRPSRFLFTGSIAPTSTSTTTIHGAS